MDNERDFIALLYFITFILFIFWYYQHTYCVTSMKPILLYFNFIVPTYLLIMFIPKYSKLFHNLIA